ncbi:unnamed protein product [Darwinula stevensoni]|uniref:Uncharacterized protein n=1 Tax=Darwinula stevensoni TaxID=69355 RepID=A0A7R9A3T3_9CRUS|nr:unnamed protein product [Darwinula stevensoni]CAG0888591.1 unnamed protein product [Darwinula stevensoni]
MKPEMEYSVMLGAFSCFFWAVSAIEPWIYWPTHHGKRYGTVSMEFQVADFAECNNTCVWKDLKVVTMRKLKSLSLPRTVDQMLSFRVEQGRLPKLRMRGDNVEDQQKSSRNRGNE